MEKRYPTIICARMWMVKLRSIFNYHDEIKNINQNKSPVNDPIGSGMP